MDGSKDKPETIVIKLVVGSEGGEGAGADAVSKEDLSGGVDPGRAVSHVAPVDLEERVEKMRLRSMRFSLPPSLHTSWAALI